MIDFLKKNLIIIGLFIITLFVGFFTFLTFIDKSFIQLNERNLQILLYREADIMYALSYKSKFYV